jgi:uncharacterized membrane protein YoaK (UPF0700 family)
MKPRNLNETDGDVELLERSNLFPSSSLDIQAELEQNPQDDLHIHSAQVPEENSHQHARQVVSAAVQKPSAHLPAPPRLPGDYESVEGATVLWASYISLICGCINAVSALTYTTYLTHITGITTRFSIGLVDSGQSTRVGFSTAIFFGINISYCAGALTTGLVTTTCSPDGKWSYLKFKYPSTSGWRWQHQLLLSVSMTALAIAYGLMQSDLPNFPTYITDRAYGKSPGFVAAIMLTTFAAAILNGFLTLNQVLVMRSAHHTGTLHDMFYFLGYSLRSLNCRFFWKFKLLSCTFVSFIGGACIGAAAYYSAFQNSAVLVSVIMLVPIWIMGVCLLVLQRNIARRDIAPEALRLTSVHPQSHDFDIMQSLASILAEINLTEYLQKFKDDDRDDDSLKTLSRLAPERIVSKYGMSLDQAAAFLEKCCSKVRPQPSDDPSTVPRARVAGEYEEVNYKHYLWAFYVSLIGGSINAFSLHGIFEQTVTHVTGLSARVGIDLVHPRPIGSSGYSADEIGAMLCVFGLSCFVCGFTLTTPGADGRLQHLKMDYPKPLSWSWRHQVILSLCFLYLVIAHMIVVNSTHGDKHYIDTIAISEGSANLIFFEACLLCTAAAAALNCFLSQGVLIPLRASHVTGTAHDIFLNLGFSLRSKSLSVMWRVRLLSTTYVGFLVGGVIGSAVFISEFGQYAVITPVIFLAPMWLCGCGFLCLQLRREFLRRLGLRGSRIKGENFEAASFGHA